MSEEIRLSTLGFVNVLEDNAGSAGSGTLVHIGDIDAILTAAHVVEAIMNIKKVGILYFPTADNTLQQIVIDMSKTDYIKFANDKYSVEGPDLALILLYPEIAGALKAKMTSIDLSVHRERRRNLVNADGKAAHVLSGIIGERTEPAQINGNRIKVIFNGLMSTGQLHIESAPEGFDRLRFEPQPEDKKDLPRSFGGMSGGGAWQIILHEGPDGEYSRKTYILCGVAFYEQRHGDSMHIYCHGPKSIYCNLLEEIERRWPRSAGQVPHEVV